MYDLASNRGFVNVGTDHDNGAFAVASIRSLWRVNGRHLYPRVRRLLITADGGGSNGYRLRVWKLERQKLADDTTLASEVCHFPPGTTKWNKAYALRGRHRRLRLSPSRSPPCRVATVMPTFRKCRRDRRHRRFDLTKCTE